ncbi:MAG: metal-sensitive transcriptional regulator [Pseudomonadota bacterium]
MEKTKLLKRLSRIEGQVRGIQKMLDEDRYCMDVLIQTQAVKSALARVEDAILENHSRSCVEAAIASGDADAQREKFMELVDLMAKARR